MTPPEPILADDLFAGDRRTMPLQASAVLLGGFASARAIELLAEVDRIAAEASWRLPPLDLRCSEPNRAECLLHRFCCSEPDLLLTASSGRNRRTESARSRHELPDRKQTFRCAPISAIQNAFRFVRLRTFAAGREG